MRYDQRAVRRLREERGLSVPKLAKKARITPRTLNYIEKGFSEPRATTLAKLAVALEVSVEAFFARKVKAEVAA